MISKLFLSLCLIVGLSAVMATNAQIESDATIYASIPHSFIVRDATLPAGEYMIKVADDYNDLNVLEIRSRQGHTAVLFDTEAVQANRAPGKSELVFDKIGDNYFLSRVFLKGDESGNELPKSRMQRRLEDGGMKAEAYSIAATRKHSKAVRKKGFVVRQLLEASDSPERPAVRGAW
ncbi:MAG TPA: hypothetical protein VKB05_15950 [Pyrinomonadaceae bacterium]|nr:hypothetical protein [Pyrinomonadaceae bacterium]